MLQVYLRGFTKLSSAINGDLMVMEVNVGLENHDYCVLLLDLKLGTTEMIQIAGLVVVECSGQSYLLMQNHGLEVFRYVIGGMQMEMEASVEEELHNLCVLLLENLLKNTEMIQIVDLEGAECHGSCLFLALHPSG